MKMYVQRLAWVIFSTLIVILSSSDAFCKDQIEEINRAIKTKSAHWKASANPMTAIPLDRLQAMSVQPSQTSEMARMRRISLPRIDNLPSHFDWRDHGGNFVTSVKDQQMDKCGSCGIFAATAQIESWWRISQQDPDLPIDLSEQSLLSCHGFDCWTGHKPSAILEFAKHNSIPQEECLPYEASDAVACNLECDDPSAGAVRIPDWGIVVGCEDVEYLKNAVYRQPVSSCLYLYQDFLAYEGGVYEYVWGDYAGYHAINIIGWDDADSCWICKNCWGDTWGEQGFFRIKWRECDLGGNITFIWNGDADAGALAVVPEALDFSLIPGGSEEAEVVLKNTGNSTLEYLARGVASPREFHPDSFNSYDGLSWWCGNILYKGYGNTWLQFLVLPALDLGTAVNPQLSFMTYWAMENPSVMGVYDGCDGCGVWISTDGGRHFEVITPDYPEYTCSKLYSFDSYFWGDGPTVPGWCGKSGGWVPALFDLSPFRADSVIIRFSLASDLGGSAFGLLADPSLLGFFVDDIRITDGERVIFANDGEAAEGIIASGERHPVHHAEDYQFEVGVPWLSLEDESGIVNPGDSVKISISVKTTELEICDYNGIIRISSNDPLQPMRDIPCRLTVERPEHDLGLRKNQPAVANLPLCLLNPMSAWIFNYGLEEETGVNVACSLFEQGVPVWADTVHDLSVQPGGSILCRFDPFMTSWSGYFDLQTQIIQVNAQDANPANNMLSCELSTTGLIDDFETLTGLFDFQGGMAVNGNVEGHSGNYSVHVNNGKPYETCADALLTLKPALYLTPSDKPELRYWIKGSTTKNQDILYVEASTDSLQWTALDSASGSFGRWTERSVPLDPILTDQDSTVRIRLHFIARGTMIKSGFRIDDVSIHTSTTSYENGQDLAGIPIHPELTQNFPNPFNASTKFQFSLPRRSHVKIQLIDILGREAGVLVDETAEPGMHSIVIDGAKLTSGMYFIKMDCGEYAQVRKCLLLK